MMVPFVPPIFTHPHYMATAHLAWLGSCVPLIQRAVGQWSHSLEGLVAVAQRGGVESWFLSSQLRELWPEVIKQHQPTTQCIYGNGSPYIYVYTYNNNNSIIYIHINIYIAIYVCLRFEFQLENSSLFFRGRCLQSWLKTLLFNRINGRCIELLKVS
jgi:hypothetical protein